MIVSVAQSGLVKAAVQPTGTVSEPSVLTSRLTTRQVPAMSPVLHAHELPRSMAMLHVAGLHTVRVELKLLCHSMHAMKLAQQQLVGAEVSARGAGRSVRR